MVSTFNVDPNYFHRGAWADSADPDQTAPMEQFGLHCFPLSNFLTHYQQFNDLIQIYCIKSSVARY